MTWGQGACAFAIQRYRLSLCVCVCECSLYSKSPIWIMPVMLRLGGNSPAHFKADGGISERYNDHTGPINVVRQNKYLAVTDPASERQNPEHTKNPGNHIV